MKSLSEKECNQLRADLQAMRNIAEELDKVTIIVT